MSGIKSEDRERDMYVINGFINFLAKTGNRAAGDVSHLRAFWDPAANGGLGNEFVERVMGVWVK